MSEHDVIIAAKGYSLVATELVERDMSCISRYLSVTTANNDGRSLLEIDFLKLGQAPPSLRKDSLCGFASELAKYL